MRDADGTTYRPHPPWEVGGGGQWASKYVFGNFGSIFSSSLLLAFSCLFFAEMINRRAEAGRDMTDAGGNRNTG